MTAPRKPGFMLPVAVTLTVLLGLYVGAYYALVAPEPWDEAATKYVALYPRIHGDWRTSDPATLAKSLERCSSFFRPIHWLDRRIRPHVWEPTP